MGLNVITYALSKKYAKEYTDTVMDSIYNSIANLNLLTNPDFSINQRGEAIYTGTADEYTYTVDRWRIKGEGSTFNTETKEVSLVDTGVFEQYVEMPVYLRGNFVTATFKVSNYSGEISIGAADTYSLITSPTTTFTTQVPSDVGGIKVSFINMSGSTVTFKPVFVKLEVGQNSTPLSPPSIAEELIKCQRCYKKWLTDGNMDIYRGNATSSTSVDFIMPMYSMRTAPIVTYSNLYAPCSGHVDESSPAITGVSNVQSDTDCTVITFDTSDQTAFAGYSLQIRGGGYLALDSEVMADILLDLSTTLDKCSLVISDGVNNYKAGSNVIPKGTSLTITATANEGYTLEGGSLAVDGDYSFVNGSTIVANANMIISASAIELFTIEASTTGCTLEMTDGVNTYNVGEYVIPAGTELTITATASEGYTLEGMTFTVDGVAFTNGSATSPITANVSIVATAIALDLPLVGEINFNTNSTWNSENEMYVVDAPPTLDFSGLTDGDVNIKITYTIDGNTTTAIGTKGSEEDINCNYISSLFIEYGAIDLGGGLAIGVLEGLGENADMVYLVAPEDYLLTHTVVLNSIEIDENIEEILSGDISYAWNSGDSKFEGTITTQTLDVSGLTNEQSNIKTYWEIDDTKLSIERYIVNAMAIISGTTTSFQQSTVTDTLTITTGVLAKIIDTDGVITTEITGLAGTGAVVTLLSIFVDENV